jgi:hypothetical protein
VGSYLSPLADPDATALWNQTGNFIGTALLSPGARQLTGHHRCRPGRSSVEGLALRCSKCGSRLTDNVMMGKGGVGVQPGVMVASPKSFLVARFHEKRRCSTIFLYNLIDHLEVVVHLCCAEIQRRHVLAGNSITPSSVAGRLSWASLAAWWRQPSDKRRWIRSNPLGLDDRLPELVRVAGAFGELRH